LPQSHFFNQSALLTATTTLEPAYLQRAVAHLLAHHDALRLRYIATEDETRKVWRQFSAPNDETLFVSLVDLDHLTPEEERQAIARANVEAQTSLRLDAGPLMRVTLFQRDGGRPDSLLIVIHHLAVDGISWRILLEDLATAYAQCRRGEAIHLPRKTTSFQDWTRRLVTHAGSEKLAAEMAYWQQPATRTLAALPIDDDAAPAHNTLDSAATVVRRLSVEESRALLQDAPAAYNTQINDLLLTALVQTMWQWTGQLGLLVDLEGHGREELFADVDLSRTVGWFTTLFPVYLHLEDVAGDRLAQPGAALKAIKEQLRRLPNRGIGYGLLRYLHPDPAIRTTLQAQPQAAVSFNYLGQFDQVLTAAGDLGHVKDWRSDQSRQGRRSHQLAVSGLITGGQLEIMWEYSANLHRPATVEQLAAHYMAALRALIAHCQSSNSGGYTPSDFSATKLKQKQLDKLMAKIQKGR
jgi:non-ribosomal peptide synthase protein (TIGR01720 family)